MIVLQNKYQTKTLYKLLKRLTKNYNHYSEEEINEVSRILKNGAWNPSKVDELREAIDGRLKVYHSKVITHKAKGDTYKIATEVATKIIHKIETGIIPTKQTLISIEDYL